jgi:hypothetical protein
MKTGDDKPLMNDVSRMCTFARLNPAGFGAGAVVRSARFFEGVGVGVGRGFGVGVGVGEADALGDGEDDDGTGAVRSFLCVQATSVSAEAHMTATKRAPMRGFIDYRTYPLSRPAAMGRDAPGPAPDSCHVA